MGNNIILPSLEVIEEMGYAFGRGFFKAFAEYEADTIEAAASVTETITPTERDEKTRIADCKTCWCNTCLQIENCINEPLQHVIKSSTPFPCEGCLDGMRYMPMSDNPEYGKDKPPCSGYIKGAENNG